MARSDAFVLSERRFPCSISLVLRLKAGVKNAVTCSEDTRGRRIGWSRPPLMQFPREGSSELRKGLPIISLHSSDKSAVFVFSLPVHFIISKLDGGNEAHGGHGAPLPDPPSCPTATHCCWWPCCSLLCCSPSSTLPVLGATSRTPCSAVSAGAPSTPSPPVGQWGHTLSPPCCFVQCSWCSPLSLPSI